MPHHVYAVACDQCDFKQEITWPLWALYQWPSGVTMEIAQVWAWCNACRRIVVAEGKHSQTILGQLAFVNNAVDGDDWSAQDIIKAKQYATYPRYANLFEDLVDGKPWVPRKAFAFRETMKWHGFWRLTRGAPPKCLTCGGVDYELLDVDDNCIPKSFPHGGCGGTISLTNDRKARVKRTLWTPEGDAIGPV